jgi:hypothetical protein
MRSFCTAFLTIGALIACLSCANAAVVIHVDKNRQMMSVAVDGEPRYAWAVSTGRAGYGTPNGTYHPERLERVWFSKKYYNSPMPHSIFFSRGFAIHGSYEINHLGGPASHGCIRLHPSNAAKLFALVREEGVGNTSIVVSGSNAPSHRDMQEVRARTTPRYALPPGEGWGYNRPYSGSGNGPWPNYYSRVWYGHPFGN